MARTLQIDVMRLVVSAHPRDLLTSHGGHTGLSAANAAAKIPRLAARPIERRRVWQVDMLSNPNPTAV